MLALVLQAGRRVAAALTYRDFRLLWGGALVSSTGTWMQKVAQSWLVFELTKGEKSTRDTRARGGPKPAKTKAGAQKPAAKRANGSRAG